MEQVIISRLHELIVTPEEEKPYPHLRVDYDADIYHEAILCSNEVIITGYSVCAAQDPAVIVLGREFSEKYPQVSRYQFMRVINTPLNEWSTETVLEFSNEDVSDEEMRAYDKILAEEEC